MTMTMTAQRLQNSGKIYNFFDCALSCGDDPGDKPQDLPNGMLKYDRDNCIINVDKTCASPYTWGDRVSISIFISYQTVTGATHGQIDLDYDNLHDLPNQIHYGTMIPRDVWSTELDED